MHSVIKVGWAKLNLRFYCSEIVLKTFGKISLIRIFERVCGL